VNRKDLMLAELRQIRDSKLKLLELLDNKTLEHGNCQREIWKIDEVIWFIESGSQDEEFR
jgi:hypothetical protein